MREIIGSDFDERAEETRIENRLPEVLVRLATGFTGDKEPPEEVEEEGGSLMRVGER